MSAGVGTSHLVLRHLRSGSGASVLVAVLVGITVLVVSLAPRALVELSIEQLRHSISQLPALQRDLTATGQFGYPMGSQDPTTVSELFGGTAANLGGMPERMSGPLAEIVSDTDWVVRTGQRRADSTAPGASSSYPVLGLAVDLHWSSRVTIVEGAAPSAWTGNERDGVDVLLREPIEIALSSSVAEQLGLVVGDILDYRPALLRVAGLYEPRDPNDAYWTHASDLDVGELRRSSDGDPLVASSAYINPASALGLLDTIAAAQVNAWLPVDGDRLELASAVEARDQARNLMAYGSPLPSGEVLEFETEFPDAIDTGLERVALVTSLLALVMSGPLGVVLAVFALGVQTVLNPRRAALALASARGADGFQLRLLMLIEGLLISIPAAALAVVVAALLIPVPVDPAAFALPVVLALAPPVFFAIAASPGSLRSNRTDLAMRARSGARWVAELAVLGLAAVSLYLLFRRGFTEATSAVGIDPLLVSTPLLLSLAVCVLVLRVYPGLMLVAQRVTYSRPGAVGLVGAARAVRAPALGFAATLALVVGISIAVFSTALSSTVSDELAMNAKLSVGADLRVSALALDDTVVSEVAAMDGVASTAVFKLVANVPLSTSSDDLTVTVVLADFGELARVRPDLNLPIGETGLSYLASDGLVPFLGDYLGGEERSTIDGHEAQLAGIRPATALPIGQPRWILIDAADADLAGLEFTPHEFLVATDGTANPPELAAKIDSVVRASQAAHQREAVSVTDSSALLTTANAEPVVAGLRLALLFAALLTALLSILAVILATLSSAPARHRLIGVLRILGMSPRQLSRLVLWELAPVTITAVVAGTALGLVELWLVMAALDLRPFLNGTAPPAPSIDLALVTSVVLGFAVIVMLAGIITTAIGRRISPASSVKMGVE